MKVRDIGTLALPALEGKFLVVETQSDGYTGTVQGNYNFEVVKRGNDFQIFPTTWDNELGRFVRADEMVLYTDGDIIYYVTRTQVDPYNHAVIEQLEVEAGMTRDNRILQAFKYFADDKFSIGNYNLFIKDVGIVISPDFVSVDGVTLDKTSDTMYIGDTVDIIATVTPENATEPGVVFSVDNPTVASFTVDGNKATVKGLAKGTAIISVTTVDGDKKATFNLTINEFINVTSVSLDKNSLELEVADVQKLVATVLPDNATTKSVSWTSDTPAVASVTPTGNVRGVSEGTAVITVKTADGAKTATCNVTVTNPTVPETP